MLMSERINVVDAKENKALLCYFCFKGHGGMLGCLHFFFLRIGDPWFVGKRKAFHQFMTVYG